MDYRPTYGWYYIDANRKSPAWTGVPYLYNYLTRSREAPGPAARESELAGLMPGDLIQLSFDGVRWAHCPVVVSIGEPRSFDTLLLAAHSEDADNRPLSSYSFKSVRLLHVFGVYKAAAP